MSYEVHKSILGKLEVRFPCPHCLQKVINPLAEAGNMQVCPSCGKPHRVPGEFEKEEAEKRTLKAKENIETLRTREQQRFEQTSTVQTQAESPNERPGGSKPELDAATESYSGLGNLADLYTVAGFLCWILTLGGLVVGLFFLSSEDHQAAGWALLAGR